LEKAAPWKPWTRPCSELCQRLSTVNH
jgi:hypothetical protein